MVGAIPKTAILAFPPAKSTRTITVPVFSPAFTSAMISLFKPNFLPTTPTCSLSSSTITLTTSKSASISDLKSTSTNLPILAVKISTSFSIRFSSLLISNKNKASIIVKAATREK